MNGTVYNASYYSDSEIRCAILKTNETTEGTVDFDVAPNGIDYAGIHNGFHYYK